MVEARANDPPPIEAPEGDMHDTGNRGGPNLGLLLLIPAAVIVAKAASHRRAMWDSESPRAMRLPPRIEAALDTWHSHAHEASEPTTPTA